MSTKIHSVEKDLAAIRPEHVELLSLTESGKPGVYKMKLRSRYSGS